MFWCGFSTPERQKKKCRIIMKLCKTVISNPDTWQIRKIVIWARPDPSGKGDTLPKTTPLCCMQFVLSYWFWEQVYPLFRKKIHNAIDFHICDRHMWQPQLCPFHPACILVITLHYDSPAVICLIDAAGSMPHKYFDGDILSNGSTVTQDEGSTTSDLT